MHRPAIDGQKFNSPIRNGSRIVAFHQISHRLAGIIQIF